MASEKNRIPRRSALDARPDLSVCGLLLDVDKFSVHDGPGIRTAVFLKGCPLGCAWCHSPESRSLHPELLYQERRCTGCGLCIAVCPEAALGLVDESATADDGSDLPARQMARIDWEKCTSCGACVEVCYPGALRIAGEWTSVSDLVEQVAGDLQFFQTSGGGVTLSGGEVAQQPEFSYHFLWACRERGIHTAIETSGHGPWRVYERLARVTDLFLYDLKQMDDARHRQLTGVSTRLVHDNLRRLAASGARIIIRVPCIPGLTDTDENISASAAFARELGLDTIHLLPYNSAAAAKYQWLGRPYGLGQLQAQSAERLEELANIGRSHGLKVQIGG